MPSQWSLIFSLTPSFPRSVSYSMIAHVVDGWEDAAGRKETGNVRAGRAPRHCQPGSPPPWVQWHNSQYPAEPWQGQRPNSLSVLSHERRKEWIQHWGHSLSTAETHRQDSASESSTIYFPIKPFWKNALILHRICLSWKRHFSIHE